MWAIAPVTGARNTRRLRPSRSTCGMRQTSQIDGVADVILTWHPRPAQPQHDGPCGGPVRRGPQPTPRRKYEHRHEPGRTSWQYSTGNAAATANGAKPGLVPGAAGRGRAPAHALLEPLSASDECEDRWPGHAVRSVLVARRRIAVEGWQWKVLEAAIAASGGHLADGTWLAVAGPACSALWFTASPARRLPRGELAVTCPAVAGVPDRCAIQRYGQGIPGG